MESELDLEIEKLDKSHEKAEFDCGQTSLNDYLRKYAAQNDRRGLSAAYVAVEHGSRKVLAYYAISSGQVACNTLPETERDRLPRYPVPVVRIGRLATEVSVRGQRIDRIILVNALRRALLLSDDLGFYAVEVDALTPKARAFYLKFGFESLEDDELRLYISINTIRKLFRQGDSGREI